MRIKFSIIPFLLADEDYARFILTKQSFYKSNSLFQLIYIILLGVLSYVFMYSPYVWLIVLGLILYSTIFLFTILKIWWQGLIGLTSFLLLVCFAFIFLVPFLSVTVPVLVILYLALSHLLMLVKARRFRNSGFM